MDQVVTVSGPFPPSSTVRHCDLGGHPLTAGEQWWTIRDASRGWVNDTGAACAAHVTQARQADGDAHAYHVGGPFDSGRTRWPAGTQLWIDDEHLVRLAIFVDHPDPREIAAINTGTARFAWTEQDINGFLLFKYGDSPWNDTPYNPQRLSKPFSVQPIPRGTHTRVITFLVDAGTGRIAAMRAFSWPAYFFNHVIASIHRLQTLPYSDNTARTAQNDFYHRYPDGPSLYRLVRTLPVEAVCTGGQTHDRPH